MKQPLNNNQPEKVASYFNKIASDFDSYYEKPENWFQALTNRFLRKPCIIKRLNLAFNALNQKNNQKILDIGCGSGVLAIPLAKHGHKVTAIDFSGPMIEIAKHKAKNAGVQIDFRVADFMKDNFSPADACVALGVLEYFKNPEEIIQKMIALVPQRGYVVFDIPALFNFHTPLRLIYLLWRGTRAYFYTTWKIQKLMSQFKKVSAIAAVHDYGAGYLVVLQKVN